MATNKLDVPELIPCLSKDTTFKIGIVLLFVLFIVLRSYHFSSPILDRHSWNQVSTAATAMNIYKNPRTFWQPDSNALQTKTGSSVMAQEFPIFMGLIALGYSLFGPSILVARVIAIAIALIGWIYLFKLCRITESRSTSLIILFIYTVNSHNWFFDRAINSDTGMVSFMLASLFYFQRYLQYSKKSDLLLVIVATTLAGLFKPFGLMIGISFLFLAWRTQKLAVLKDPYLWMMGLVVWIINISWLLYTKIYVSTSIGLGHKLGFDLGILLSWRYYYVLSQRIFDQILTPFLALFFLYALFSKKIRSDIGAALWAGNVFYLVYITHGNLEHNYYQLPLTPALCIYAGLGFSYWLALDRKRIAKPVKIGLVVLVLAGFCLYSGKKAYNHFKLALGPLQLGNYIKSLQLNPDTIILAVETAGTRYHEILYFSELKGYVARKLSPADIIAYKERGVEFVAVHLEEKEYLNSDFMKPFKEYLIEIWSSSECLDSYSRPCLIGLYKIP